MRLNAQVLLYFNILHGGNARVIGQCCRHGRAKRRVLHAVPKLFRTSMKTTSSWPSMYHPLVALFCFVALGVACYLQLHLEMDPCPLCILQRYVFLAVGLVATVSSFCGARAQRKGAWAAVGLSLAGLSMAGWLLWVRAHPSVSCGVDKLQLALNKLPSAEMFPLLFRSEGFCTGDWAPVIGLSVPTWSFLGFAVLLTFLLVMPRLGRPRR